MALGENLVKEISHYLTNESKQHLITVYDKDFLETSEIYCLAELIVAITPSYGEAGLDIYEALYYVLLSIPGVTQKLEQCNYGLLASMTRVNFEKNKKPKKTLEEAEELCFAIRMMETQVNPYKVKFMEELADAILTGIGETPNIDIVTLWMAYKMLRYERRLKNGEV